MQEHQEVAKRLLAGNSLCWNSFCSSDLMVHLSLCVHVFMLQMRFLNVCAYAFWYILTFQLFTVIYFAIVSVKTNNTLHVLCVFLAYLCLNYFTILGHTFFSYTLKVVQIFKKSSFGLLIRDYLYLNIWELHVGILTLERTLLSIWNQVWLSGWCVLPGNPTCNKWKVRTRARCSVSTLKQMKWSWVL